MPQVNDWAADRCDCGVQNYGFRNMYYQYKGARDHRNGSDDE